jgi:hypothetical protein
VKQNKAAHQGQRFYRAEDKKAAEHFRSFVVMSSLCAERIEPAASELEFNPALRYCSSSAG